MTAYDGRLDRPWSPKLVFDLARRARDGHMSCVIGVNQRDRSIAVLAGAGRGIPSVLMVQNQHHFWGNPILARAKRVPCTPGCRAWRTSGARRTW